MKYTLREPKEYFNANVPDDFQKKVERLIIDGCRNAEDEVIAEGFDYEVHHDHYPYERRSRIEQLFAKLREFPGVTVERRPNRKHTAYYTVARINDVILTVSKVSAPSRLPRIANFRNELAGAQSSFTFTTNSHLKINNPIYPGKKTLYAMVIYGVDKKKPSVPTFIDIVFPDKSCLAALDRIHLLKISNNQTDLLNKNNIKTEQISDNAQPKLKEATPVQLDLL